MSEPLRILHCMRAPVGGLFRHVLDLAAEQASRGHAVGILADSTASDRLTDERFAAIAPALSLGITRVPMSRKPGAGDVAAAKFTFGLARRLSANVLHGHGAKGGAYARLASQALKATGHPVVSFYTPHGGSLNYRPNSLEGRIYLSLEKLLAHCTDGLVFESAFAHRVYGERVGIRNVPARVIPNGLQPSDFAKPALAGDATDILFIGELRDIKGVDVLLRALEILNRERAVTATIVGSGPDAESLKALAAELKLSDRVRFPGAMPAAAAFRMGRALAVPSRAESFPYVVLEAGAAGLPLISTNVGGIPEIVAETDTRLIPSDNVTALADAIRVVLADPVGAEARAARLRARVASRFTVSEMTRSVLEFYEACRNPAAERDTPAARAG